MEAHILAEIEALLKKAETDGIKGKQYKLESERYLRKKKRTVQTRENAELFTLLLEATRNKYKKPL